MLKLSKTEAQKAGGFTIIELNCCYYDHQLVVIADACQL